MEQIRQLGEVLGSLKALMVFRDEIRINPRQCCLLADLYTLAFERIAEEIRHNLRFEEKFTKWNALENPLRELHRLFREGEQYIKQCLEPKDWWAKAVFHNQNTDCIDFHVHNLLWCVSVVMEAIENASEISGCDQESIYKTRLILTKKYEREWMDQKLFQLKFGRSYLVTQEICSKLDSTAKEDQWILSEMVSEKRNTPLTKLENQLADLILAPKGKIFPSSVLVGSKDYQVKRRIGTSGGQYKEIQWMGECFALKHFFGEIAPSLPEISLLTSVAHPNVMHYMYAFFDEDRKECFLLMELMNKDVSSYIKEICSTRRRIPFPLLVAVDIMLQIARGMEYLHSRKIYHGDLNPSNILVRTRNSSPDGYLHAKVTGFGLSNAKNPKVSPRFPCIWYAPEVLAEQEQSAYTSCKYSEKADVYSFAMICFELLTGKIPFEDDHLQGDKTSRNIRAGERPLFPFPSPRYLTNLTKKCWQADPSQRPSFSSICRMLRYIKRFLIMNPDHGQLDLPCPPVDYIDLETSLSKRFPSWVTEESLKVSEIPFQMFAYRIIERERISVNLKERSSESESEGASVCGDENGFNMMIDDTFGTALALSRSPSLYAAENLKRAPSKKGDARFNKQSGQYQKGGAIKPPQLLTLRGRSLKMPSERQFQPVAMSPGRRRASGHVSDSELP